MDFPALWARATPWREFFRPEMESYALWRGVADQARFYFVHSYYVEVGAPDVIAGSSDYPHPFTCAIATDNVFAVQFHPEKSGTDGLTLLQNFVRWQPAGWFAPRRLAATAG